MIQNGTKLSELNLFDVLVNFIDSREKADTRFIKSLIENGIKLDYNSKKQNTNVMLLSYLGLDEILDDLISKGFDINITNNFGMNAFHWAVAGGQYTTAKLLMEKGVDIYAKVKFEVEYYDKTISKADRLKRLIAKSIYKQYCDNAEEIINDDYDDEGTQRKTVDLTVFALSFNKYNPKIVKLLLKKGFNPNEDVMRQNSLFNFFDDKPISEYHINESSISVVCKNNNTELLKLMIKKGANGFDTSDLAKACENLNFKMIKLLVEAGVNINFSTKVSSGKNPLSIVCSNSAIEPIEGNCASKLDIHGNEVFDIIKYLIDHGADVNIDSPLMATCSFNYPYGSITGNENQFFADVNINIIRLLIEKGANVNFANKQKGQSILMEAVNRLNFFELANILIEHGANINHKDNLGNSVLMNIKLDSNLSDLYGMEESELNEYDGYNDIKNIKKTINLLIEKGADLNIKNNMGFTVLMKYSFENYKSFVRILLKHGADINAKSEMTAFDLTQNEEIKELIQKAKNNNPQKLVKLLSNFTIDKPIKYTTHNWDFGELKKEYGDFNAYMNAVKKQFEDMESEIKVLSPNLYKKIHAFLLEDSPDTDYSWCSKTPINIGWSSLEGLKKHCDEGKNPFDFKLQEPQFKNLCL